MLITGSNDINFEGEDFDLNKIFHLSYNFDLLKNVLGKIITEQKKTKDDINKLQNENQEKNKKIDG
jgi:hypothetical protein